MRISSYDDGKDDGDGDGNGDGGDADDDDDASVYSSAKMSS